jgi:hypothetical protein
MRKIFAIVLIMFTLGCSAISPGSGNNNKMVPPPADEFLYQTTRTVIRDDGSSVTVPTDFTLLESKVNIENFCTGCTGSYYIKFWYVPLQTDCYTRTSLADDDGVDSAILSKQLYSNVDLGVSQADSIYSLNFTDKNWNKITISASLEAQSYNPDTRELIISGFPKNETSYFTITYFHNPVATGYEYIEGSLSWIKIPQKTVTVPPFTVRCVPVVLTTPDDATLPYKFEIDIGVKESKAATNSMVTVPRALQERWLITCRETN